MFQPGVDPFEIGVEDVRGVPMEVFVNRPRYLREVLDDAAQQWPDREYVIFGDVRLTFSQFHAEVAALAAGFERTHGIGKGDRIAVLSMNRLEWVLTFWAATSLGAVLVGLNGWWSTGEIDDALELTEPNLLLVDDKLRPRLGERDGTPGHERPCPVLRIEDLRADLVEPNRGAAMPTIPIDEDDAAAILFTSGTSGRSKGAVNPHRTILGFISLQATAQVRQRAAGEEPARDVGFTAYPLFHVSGLYGSVVMATLIGATMVFMTGRFEPAGALKIIQDEGVTRLSIVPTTAMRIANEPTAGNYDTRSLRRIAGGGAPTSPEMQAKLERIFPNATFGFGYGLTEGGGLATGASHADLEEHPDTAGRPYPTIRVEIHDAANKPVADGVEGEICIRSPLNTPGYWRNPEATAATYDEDMFFHTGDIGMLRDGLLYLTSRRTDLILRGGENVYPAEIEQRLEGHPAIAEAAVVGVPHDDLGQEVLGIIVLKAGTEASEADLTDYLKDKLASFKIPSRWLISSIPLPRNATGKIVRRDLASHVEGRPTASVTEPE